MDQLPRDRRSSPAFEPRSLIALVLLGALSSCAADRRSRDTEPTPTYESRTGIPVLMDLPLIGWLFQHRVTVR
jgi:hypothetical protein